MIVKVMIDRDDCLIFQTMIVLEKNCAITFSANIQDNYVQDLAEVQLLGSQQASN